MAISQELEKAKRIKKEMTRLRRLFKSLSKDKQQAAEGLIQEAAFMRVTLEELRQVIDAEGILDAFEQGGDIIVRRHPAARAYVALVQRYCTTSKLLTSLLPVGGHDVEDELMAFVKRQRQ